MSASPIPTNKNARRHRRQPARRCGYREQHRRSRTRFKRVPGRLVTRTKGVPPVDDSLGARARRCGWLKRSARATPEILRLPHCGREAPRLDQCFNGHSAGRGYRMAVVCQMKSRFECRVLFEHQASPGFSMICASGAFSIPCSGKVEGISVNEMSSLRPFAGSPRKIGSYKVRFSGSARAVSLRALERRVRNF